MAGCCDYWVGFVRYGMGVDMIESKIASQIKCPKCKCDQVMKCSMAYASGTSSGQMAGHGGTISTGGRLGLGAFNGVVHQQTLLAQSASPPKYPSSNDSTVLILAAIVCGILAFGIEIGSLGYFQHSSEKHGAAIIFAIASLICCCFIPRLVVRYRRAIAEHGTAYDLWERTWVCLRCGSRFIRR